MRADSDLHSESALNKESLMMKPGMQNNPAPAPDLIAALTAALGAENVVTDDGVAQAHAGDWSEAPRLPPAFVLYPRTPQQVAAALDIMSRHGQRLAVQGGLTGLAGGATPQPGEAVMSLAKMNRIEEFDEIAGTVTVQAGVTLEQLQTQVEAHGWLFPLDLGARGSCQLGGNAATNAGGNRVIRYGMMRELVLGLEVVLANGTILTMLNRVTKNATGIDLKHLFIGAEGTLGVITRLVLKLFPRPASTVTALCALPSFREAALLVRELRRALPGLSAFELMWADFMDAAVEVTGARPPFAEAAAVYALVELQGSDDTQDRDSLEAFFGKALEDGLVSDVIVAQSMEHAKQLWRYREAVGELLAKLKPHAAFDVGIPMQAMEAFVENARQALADRFPMQRHLFFGHLGDGNLHVLSGPYESAQALHAVETIVYEAVGAAGGAISAEHGIGVVKKKFLHLSRSVEELAVMQELKALMDPGNILNGGRIVDSRKG
jgi:FAD/FMN-containing dehydrogenase